MKTHTLTFRFKQPATATARNTRNNSSTRTGIKITALLALTILSLATTASFAANAENGKKIYESKCGGCHDTRVHTRPNRIVHTYEDLVNRVRFCDANAKTSFTESDILDVSEYLNNEFYKFLKMDQ